MRYNSDPGLLNLQRPDIYNGISPNGDGKNDKWVIEYIELLPDTQKNRVTIYNRWGDMVWEATDYNNSSIAFDGQKKMVPNYQLVPTFLKLNFRQAEKPYRIPVSQKIAGN